MTYLISGILLVSLSIGLIIAFGDYFFYRRRLARLGRTVSLRDAKEAVVNGGHGLVRIGVGRNPEVWIINADILNKYKIVFEGKDSNDCDIFVNDIAEDACSGGKLVVGYRAPDVEELITVASKIGSFVDIPTVPDVDYFDKDRFPVTIQRE